MKLAKCKFLIAIDNVQFFNNDIIDLLDSICTKLIITKPCNTKFLLTFNLDYIKKDSKVSQLLSKYTADSSLTYTEHITGFKSSEECYEFLQESFAIGEVFQKTDIENISKNLNRNPFYLEQMIYWLQEKQVLEQRKNSYKIKNDILFKHLIRTIPNTVYDILLDRWNYYQRNSESELEKTIILFSAIHLYNELTKRDIDELNISWDIVTELERMGFVTVEDTFYYINVKFRHDLIDKFFVKMYQAFSKKTIDYENEMNITLRSNDVRYYLGKLYNEENESLLSNTQISDILSLHIDSSWGAANDIVSCMKNGLTLEMPDPKGFHTDVLKEAYKDGRITDQELDNWTKNVLQNFVSLHKNIEENYEVDMEEQNQVARKLENESAVLLKNNSVLPIGKEKKVIIIGELARQMRFQGGGSSHIQPTKMTNAIEAIREKGYQVTYIQGYQNEKEELGEKQLQDTIEKLKQEYRKKDCVILYFIGLTESYEGEGYDRKNLKIPQNQEELLAEIAETVGKDHIAAISFGGAPMDFSFEKNVGAILHMYLGGQAVGESVADLISGEVNPSGKLAETIPFSEKDTPAWRYFAPPNDDVEYRESIFVGYRYYETFHVPVKYPFGYGLSYTSFSYSELSVPEAYSGGKIQIGFKIKNIGKVSGAEIAQLYICPIESDVIRSHIELKGFQKIYLHPGEEKEVILELDERSFSVYDVEKKAFSMLSGKYQICIGASVHDLQLKANMEVVGNSYFRNERELFPDYFREQPHGMEISAEQFYQLLGGEPKHDKEKKRGEYTVYDSYQDVVNVSMFGKFVRGVVHIGLKIILRGKSERDPAFKMVKMGVEEGNLEGLIATSGGIATPKLIDMLVYNANKKYLQAFKRLLKK